MAQRPSRPLRYALVGLGHIAQAAVLPAFSHAPAHATLAALVSGDAHKRRVLSRRHRVPAYDYGDFERALAEERIDAVYLAVPNHLHCEFAVRAAQRRVHVLCEKPMATSTRECQEMIDAAEANDVRLMIAYRLHFEPATLGALELARSGALGELRIFDSVFSMQVRPHNVRLEDAGGGPLADIGIYCLQAARLLFDALPFEGMALHLTRPDDERFREVPEMTTATLRFPDARIATFTCSFGAADVSSYRIVGSEGELRVEPAYEYQQALVHHLSRDGHTRTRRFARRDQFAPQLMHFTACVLGGHEPEPSGREGLVDVAILQALERSAQGERWVAIPPLPIEPGPDSRQQRKVRPVGKPKLVRAASASQP